MHRYPARLTPYIPLYFLGVSGVAVKGGRLLDPFAGCGTVLVEAPVHFCNPMTAVGLEINPLARLIAKVKTTPVDRRALRAAWARVQARYETDRGRAGLSEFPNKRHWFTAPVERRLAKVIRAFGGLRDADIRDFLLVALSSVVRRVALADPRVSVPVILDPTRFDDKTRRKSVEAEIKTRSDADVFAMLEQAVSMNLDRLQLWSTAVGVSGPSASIVGMDARTFALSEYLEAGNMGAPGVACVENLDLVLTSPPYANAQRYTRSLRLELFALGFAQDASDEAVLDRLQVGTERIAKREREKYYAASGSNTADLAVRAIRRDDPYRAAIVGKYVRDMCQVVENCYRALKPGAHAIFVLGNNCVRGRILDNTAIMLELGKAAGFDDVLVVKNRIPSRGLLTKRHPTAGVITHEHVLVLKKPSGRSRAREQRRV